MKLYAVSDGPPSLAVRMTLQALNIPFGLVNVDYCASEHMTDDYAKVIQKKPFNESTIDQFNDRR